MGRAAIHESEFTPFGLWIKEYLDPCMTVTNIDYFLFKIKGDNVYAMLLEEKTNNGRMTDSQLMALRFISNQLTEESGKLYDFQRWGKKTINYWGFYMLKFVKGATMPGPGMTMNGKEINIDELKKHMDFETKFCEGLK